MRTCEVQAGQVWRHFKGSLYQIVCVGVLESNLTPMVVYRAASGEGSLWIRPLVEFLGETSNRGELPHGGMRMVFEERFTLVAESNWPKGTPNPETVP